MPDARKPIGLASSLTCPVCGTVKEEVMPTDACRFFYTCTGCSVKLQPKPGDCCVFCSYGSVPCPPVQFDERAAKGPAKKKAAVKEKTGK